jgi:phosphoribosylanthranilate isomerase
MTRVKICGLTTPGTLDAALDAGADMVGLVHVPASPRHVSLVDGALLAARARGRAALVALLVDPDDAQVSAVCAALGPDLLQLHGSEDAARTAAIARLSGRPVIKACGVSDRADLDAALALAHGAQHLLLDARAPAGAAYPGGHGAVFDWDVLEGAALPPGWMLSGGLTPDSVAGAVARLRPWGVDVSSGVERVRGVKDPDLIRAFVSAVRSADAA